MINIKEGSFRSLSAVKVDRDPLSKSYTSILRNLFSIFIFFCHGSTSLFFVYPWYTNLFYFGIGYLATSYFFFISGYGIYTSVMKKDDFSAKFLKNNIIPLIINLGIATIIKIIVKCIITRQFSLIQIIRWFFSLDLIDPSHWFLVTLMAIYTFFFLIHRFFPRHCLAIVAVLYLLTYIVMFALGIKNKNWMLSPPSWLVGAVTAKHLPRIRAFTSKHYIAALIILTGMGVGVWVTLLFTKYENSSNWYFRIVQMIASAAFPLWVTLVSEKIRIGNFFLAIGDFSIGLYIIHPLINMPFERFPLTSTPYGAVISVLLFIAAVIIGRMYTKFFAFIRKKIVMRI